MAVLRFCLCGQPVPEEAQACPGCGRARPAPVPPFGLRAVEVASESVPPAPLARPLPPEPRIARPPERRPLMTGASDWFGNLLLFSILLGIWWALVGSFAVVF